MTKPRKTTEAAGGKPWRILHVEMGRHLHGGAQQVVHLVTGLRARGIKNIVACERGSEVAAALHSVADHVDELHIAGELDPSLALKLAAIARKRQASLIHLHSRRGADVWGGVAGRWHRLPVVLSRRVDTPEPWSTVAWKYRLFDRVVAISQCIEQVLRESGVEGSKLRCVHSGIDPGPYSQPADRQWLLREFGFEQDALIAGMIAQLIPRKGHSVLLDAVSALAPQWPNLRVLLLGRGSLEASLHQEIAARRLQQHIRLAGFRPDLPRVVPALDLVVHPALAEGLGVALIQAAAAGVPIVGSRAGGIPEIVRHGENGLLVEPGDAKQLAGGIEKLLADPHQRAAMGQLGREFVRAQFSLDRMVCGNLTVYEELLGPRPSVAAPRAAA